MNQESERTLILLKELAVLRDTPDSGSDGDAEARRNRRKQIGEEIKQLARKKQHR
jgi:hypothetical protein